jgi:hypothetical protein
LSIPTFSGKLERSVEIPERNQKTEKDVRRNYAEE